MESRFIIAIILPEDVAKYHQDLSNKVGERFGLRVTQTPSHITLKDSFYTSNPFEVESIIGSVISDAEYNNPEVTISGIDNFREEIYFMNSELNKDAFQIHTNLITNLRQVEWLQWDQFDTVDRNFHVTITTKANPENANRIEKFLEDYDPKFSFRLDNISILKKIEDEKRWIVHRRFVL